MLNKVGLVLLATSAVLTINTHSVKADDLFNDNPHELAKEEKPSTSPLPNPTPVVVETVQKAPEEVKPVLTAPTPEALTKPVGNDGLPNLPSQRVRVLREKQTQPQAPKVEQKVPAPAQAQPQAKPAQEAKGYESVLGKVVVDYSDPNRTPERGELITENLRVTSPWGDRTKFLSPQLIAEGASTFHHGVDFAWAHQKGADRTPEFVYFAPGNEGDEFKVERWHDPNGGGYVLDMIYTKGNLKGKVVRIKHLDPKGQIKEGHFKWKRNLEVARVGNTGIGAHHGDITVMNHSGSGRARRADAVPPTVPLVLSVVTGKPISEFKSAPAPVPQAPKPAAGGGGASSIDEYIFQGGADSLVAVTVGSAEGTRTPTGAKTRAYKGHTDPGNGVWNLGSFSYQHGAKSPEEADVKQLKRLQGQFASIEQQAKAKGIELTLEEKLNGIDLANQAPKAALDRGGYIDRLAEAKQAGKEGDDAILWARTYSYMNPDTQKWEAPGLGNTVESITHDQNRRMGMIADALTNWREKNPDSLTNKPQPQVASSNVGAVASTPDSSGAVASTPDSSGAVPTSRVIPPGQQIMTGIDDALDALFSLDVR